MKRALFYSKLSRSFFALVSFLFLFTPLWGQDEEAGQTPFFREDQWYLGASFMILQTKETAFKPQGLSRHFQWGFIRDIPLTSNGKLATGIGLGFILYPLMMIAKGKTKEIHPIMYGMLIIFLAYFMFLPHA